MSDLQHYQCNFKIDGKPKTVEVFHTLPDTPGLDIQSAFDSWVYRTNKWTSASFRHYIMEKVDKGMLDAIVMTRKEYEKFMAD